MYMRDRRNRKKMPSRTKDCKFNPSISKAKLIFNLISRQVFLDLVSSPIKHCGPLREIIEDISCLLQEENR